MLRRTKEFDRANTIDEIFSGILPDHHFIMKTNDKFKQHRRWLQDIMTHDFLHQVAAPRVYTAFGDLMGLWGEKTRLAEGHPFAPAEDVYRAALDAAWNVIFGANPSNNATRLQLEYCASIKAIEQPGDKDKEVHIPHAQDPAIFKAVITLTDSLAVAVQSPLPAEAHWVIRQFPYMRKAKAVKDKFMKEEVEKSLQRFAGKGANEIEATCGKDEILRREMLLSEKEGRAPLYHSKGMYDEVLHAPEMYETFPY